MALRGVKCPIVPIAWDFTGTVTAASVLCMTWAAQTMCMGWVHLPLARRAARSGIGVPCKLTSFPPLFPGEAQPRKLHTIPIPAARCYTYSWDQDNFGKRKESPVLPSETAASAPCHRPG